MAAKNPNVLFVLTSVNANPTTGHPTGWYLPEFAHAHEVLVDKVNITVASPKGGKAPLDPQSVEMYGEDPYSKKFLEEYEDLWHNTEKLSEVLKRVHEFDAVYYVGGHGPMWDLVGDADSLEIIRELADKNKVVAGVCHGTAALINAKLSDGSYLVVDAEVTGFSNAEEDFVGQSANMPFALETALGNQKARYVKVAEVFGEKVVIARNGKLITGQNPNSARPLGEAILKELTA